MPTACVTVPSAAAERIARTLVEERLAAGVNRVDCTSTYRWEGAVRTADEAIIFAKTTDERYDDLVERVLDLHPYDVPCVERIDETDCHGPYERWREQAVAD